MTEPRTVLVTGGNRGIGLASAKLFADAGHRVAITSRNPDTVDDRIFAVACDQTDSDAVDGAFEVIEAELGAVEVLVANAGITRDQLLLRMSDDDFSEVVDTNLTGAYRMARRAARPMLRARWGRLIFISSVVGLLGAAGQVNYAASKAGLIGLARSMARELGSRNITANVVAPGPVATDMLASLSEEQRTAITNQVPLGRVAQPEEIAEMIRFLASESGAYITGAVIPVDGGLGMGH
ncbi:MAG: 3-oxoacyl-ACP reductase FabG [Actinomycetota bacterium]|nr:beta-ketoacyl-ACP reductase [Acidimicrobiaceae bacterium]MCS5674965.1 3-oxoacyl-ACP reductase FabG [Acidimicrobiales bacterium]MED5541826.1 3-oxoacyl-ACP reductase FabG [Actinomycetota bacterium]MEE2806780.1 3-oxoacyl-ACP reductase FabG [Actinomycetota bacterium]